MTPKPPFIFRPRFVPPGEVLQPRLGRIALDTGNALGAGIIDHHQEDAPEACTTSLIAGDPALVLDAVRDIPPPEVEVCLHRDPDFDSVAAATLVDALLRRGKLPRGAEELARYALAVDRATLQLPDHPETTPYGVFQGVACQVRERVAAHEFPADDADPSILARGLELMRSALRRIATGHDVFAPRFLPVGRRFAAEQRLIARDRQAYLQDLKRARPVTVELPDLQGRLHRVHGLVLEQPSSALFKVWARQDRKHSPEGQGFVLLVVRWPGPRYIISVPPESGLSLKHLGAALERAEVAKRAALGCPRRGPRRPGYEGPDPWYDGRSPIHRHTIVDTPHGGTVLDPGEIEAICLRPIS